MSKTQLIGYLGNDPIIRECKNGNRLAVLRLATDERIKKSAQGAQEYKATWHSVAVWGPEQVIHLGNLMKGSHVLIEGKLEYQSYVDRKGIKRYVTEINAFLITDLDR